ncbi:hypothetical protein P9139_12150 [Curtobacterium flaccumfaciens]|nr:hypothetical protein P9139_12150 [Curtobacterium flaccumfaciens]
MPRSTGRSRLHRDALDERLASWSDDDIALLAGLLERLGAADEAGLPMPGRSVP